MKKVCQILVVFGLVIIPLTSVWAMTDARTIRYGLTTAGDNTGLKNPRGSASGALATEAGRIVGTVLSFLGIIFLVLMIAGGIIWMTAGGNDAKVKTARSLIVAAIIGLIIVLSAYAITTFVANNLVA